MTIPATMAAADVLDVVASMSEAGIDAWIAGGWAVDALLGEQTRPHRDLDVAVRSEHLDDAIDRLEQLGYRRALDLLPVRLVMEMDAGRAVDLHPVTFDAAGHGRQSGGDGRIFDYPPDGFGNGSINDVVVPCLTADQLVRFHLGYEPLGHDRHDMAQLRERLGVEVPPPY